MADESNTSTTDHHAGAPQATENEQKIWRSPTGPSPVLRAGQEPTVLITART